MPVNVTRPSTRQHANADTGRRTLSAQGIDKRFGGAHALRSVDLYLTAGRSLALVGENGAGKSTLISILTGSIKPDAGTITVAGHRATDLSPAEALKMGVAAIRQEPVLVPELSVAENLLLGLEPRVAGIVRPRLRRATAQSWLDDVGADIDPDVTISQLRPAERQLVEIARAVGAGSRILFFDEPTSCLTPREVDRLFGLIRRLTSQGAAVAYVSHRLDEILEVTDDVVVLRDGQRVAAGVTANFSAHMLASAMAGREVDSSSSAAPRAIDGASPVLRLVEIASGNIGGVSLDVYPGELHGIAGIVGSSRSRLLGVVAGAVPLEGGEMQLNGAAYRPSTPKAAMSRRIAYVPEDRRRDSLFGDLSQATNVAFSALPSRAGVITSQWETTAAKPTLERLDVRPRRPSMAASQLSGGNQQKLVMGRALLIHPILLVLDEPTKGVDVSAKKDIHTAILDAADNGAGILMVSSDLSELMTMATRITVMDRGRAVATFEPPFDATELMAAATGGQGSTG